jgi:transcription-repair coupling factor (superfamily II helicase)
MRMAGNEAQPAGELQSFLAPIAQSQVLAEILRRLTDSRHVAATGQWGSCALALAAIVQKQMRRPMLILTAHLDEADDAVDQLSFFRRGGGSHAAVADVRLYPAFEVLPGESNISHELAAQRLELLTDLISGDAQRARPDFVVAPIQAVMQPSPGKSLLADLVKTVRVGDTLDRDALVRWLADHGYTRLDAVEDAGDFAVRGEIVDVWPPGVGEPLRVDFFGDQIESVHHFDPKPSAPPSRSRNPAWSPSAIAPTGPSTRPPAC